MMMEKRINDLSTTTTAASAETRTTITVPLFLEKQTVIVVTSGEYSSYHVVGIFSTKEKAADFKSKFPDEDFNDDEIVELDSESIKPMGGDYKIYEVAMEKDGTTYELYKKSFDISGSKNASKLPFNLFKYIYRDGKKISPPGGVLCLTTWAKDEKHAVKIANEVRTNLIALNLWDPGEYCIDEKKTYKEWISANFQKLME